MFQGPVAIMAAFCSVKSAIIRFLSTPPFGRTPCSFSRSNRNSVAPYAPSESMAGFPSESNILPPKPYWNANHQ